MKSFLNLLESYSPYLNETLLDNYNNLLKEIFTDFENENEGEFWSSGMQGKFIRIKWKDVRRAEKEIKELKQSGVYIIGFNKNPIYIGKTDKSFRKRFGLYIFESNSICNLADMYSDFLESNPPISNQEFIEKYKVNIKKKGRVHYAKEFTEVGISSIWFVLIPISKENPLSVIEASLIYVGELWNQINNKKPLINKDKHKTIH